jgi:hypothetical protein
VGDGEGFVGLEVADVAQDLDGLTAGHQAQRRFDSSELLVRDGVAKRFEDGCDHPGAAAFARVRVVVARAFGREPQIHVVPGAGAVEPLVGQHVTVEQVDELQEAVLGSVPAEGLCRQLLDLADVDVDRQLQQQRLLGGAFTDLDREISPDEPDFAKLLEVSARHGTEVLVAPG